MADELISEAPLTILVIEDYDDTRIVLSEFLQRYGYEVLEAENGQEGLLKAQQTNPNLILIDLAMPELDGIAALREIRRTPALSRTPIFVMSAYLTEDVGADAFAAGCNEIFAKPIDIEALLIRIAETLATRPALVN